MTSHKRLRLGLCFALGHFVVIAILIPFEIICRTGRIGWVAFQIHYIVDAPVWNAPYLLSHVLASPVVTRTTLFTFPGPNFSPALVGLELAVFGVSGGLMYFAVGVIVGLIIERRRKGESAT